MKFKDTPRFERTLRRLKKRYPHITIDLQQAFAAIESNSAAGVIIPDDFAIRKLRVSSSDMKRGKSGGFRLLYKLLSAESSDLTAVLLYLYPKVAQSDVSASLLQSLNDEWLGRED